MGRRKRAPAETTFVHGEEGGRRDGEAGIVRSGGGGVSRLLQLGPQLGGGAGGRAVGEVED